MKRRTFFTSIGAAVVASQFPAAAQRLDPVRRVGALFSQAEADPEGQARAAALERGLQELGWTTGQNIYLDYRWAGGSIERMRPYAAELVTLNPHVIFASATVALTALQQATHTIPIVFAQVTDPVGAGFVASLARPSGNITGLTQHEFAIGGKWLELLRQLAPRVTRVAILYDPGNPATTGYLREIASAAPTVAVQISALAVRDESDITRALNSFAAEPNGGVILLPGPVGANNRDLIIALAARHQLPAVYAFRYHVVSGGLASYGIDNIDLYRRAAWYVDRILKGEKPADLPVQHAAKFQLVINLKTARALGLDPPISLLARTDEVIE
ncbi:MAG: ABC transporter substrate-binding protein [Xanthobacteraceae bacterium]|jgi:putative tryptophan/tyrosine transport system substrate-binding protein